MNRIPVHTTLDKDLYNDLKSLALYLSINSNKKINVNDLMEESFKSLLKKYKNTFKGVL